MGMFNGARQPICLDASVEKNGLNKPVNLWPCHSMGGNQYWMLSVTGEIRRDDACFDYTGKEIMIYTCHGSAGNQKWIYRKDNTLYHPNSALCLELSADGLRVDMSACTGTDRQVWMWRRKALATTQPAHNNNNNVL